MPDRSIVDSVAVDPELLPGARNAIEVCLRLQPNERITIITDEATRDRGEREGRGEDDEHALAAEGVAEPAGDRQRRDAAERVDGDGPRSPRDAGIQVAAEGRQRGGDHRAVDRGQQQRA